MHAIHVKYQLFFHYSILVINWRKLITTLNTQVNKLIIKIGRDKKNVNDVARKLGNRWKFKKDD